MHRVINLVTLASVCLRDHVFQMNFTLDLRSVAVVCSIRARNLKSKSGGTKSPTNYAGAFRERDAVFEGQLLGI